MHPIENIMQTTMKEIKEMVGVTTIVGDAIVTPDGSTVIPVSRVGFGFATGGGEYDTVPKEKGEGSGNMPFAGGAGAGVSVTPMAFLIVNENEIKMMSVNHRNTYDKMIDAVPELITEIAQALKSCGCTKTKQQG